MDILLNVVKSIHEKVNEFWLSNNNSAQPIINLNKLVIDADA